VNEENDENEEKGSDNETWSGEIDFRPPAHPLKSYTMSPHKHCFGCPKTEGLIRSTAGDRDTEVWIELSWPSH
jgi:hypothetical protein